MIYERCHRVRVDVSPWHVMAYGMHIELSSSFPLPAFPNNSPTIFGEIAERLLPIGVYLVAERSAAVADSADTHTYPKEHDHG